MVCVPSRGHIPKNWFKGKSEGVEDVSFKPGMDPKGKIIIESPSQIIARMKTLVSITVYCFYKEGTIRRGYK